MKHIVTPMSFRFITQAILVLTMQILAPKVSAQNYQVQALPLPVGLVAPTVTSINDSGQVLGNAYSADFQKIYAIVWSGGQPTVLPELGGSGGFGSYGFDINNQGVVAGYTTLPRSYNGFFPVDHGFVWSGATGIVDLAVEQNRFQSHLAAGINDAGLVLGNTAQAFLWSSPSSVAFLNAAPLRNDLPVDAWAINNEGNFILSGTLGTATASIVRIGGVNRVLPSPGTADYYYAVNLNNANQAIGYGYSPAYGYLPCYWDANQVLTVLPTIFATGGALALAINDASDVVGSAGFATGWGAALWRAGSLVDLNTLIGDASAQWRLNEADAVNTTGQIAGVGEFNGVATPFLLSPVAEPKIVGYAANRDNPSATVSERVKLNPEKPVYAGTNEGDLVFWEVEGAGSGNFHWSALRVGAAEAERIDGPEGRNRTSWALDAGSFNWAPGSYVITVAIAPDSGPAAASTYTQAVGWRTPERMVVGQVKPINDYTVNSGQRNGIRQALVNSYGLGSDYLALVARNFLSALPVERNIQFWVGYRFYRYVADGGVPPIVRLNGVSTNEKYWMVQTLLSQFPDTVDLPASVDAAKLVELRGEESYRMFIRVQFRYLVDDDRKIIKDSVFPVRAEAQVGPTKFDFPIHFTATATVRGSEINVDENSSQLLISGETSPASGKVVISQDGIAISYYVAGRVGIEGRVPNYALFARDAPFIFTEIIAQVGADGRDTDSRIRVSVDKTWRPGGAVTGTVHFNEIRVYERDYTTAGRPFALTLGGGMPIAGQLAGFIQSGSRTWPGTPPPPSIQ